MTSSVRPKTKRKCDTFPDCVSCEFVCKNFSIVSPYPELISIRNLGATDLYTLAIHSQAHAPLYTWVYQQNVIGRV